METMENKLRDTQTTGPEYTYFKVKQNNLEIVVRVLYTDAGRSHEGWDDGKRTNGYPERTTVENAGEPISYDAATEILTTLSVDNTPAPIRDMLELEEISSTFHKLIQQYDVKHQLLITKAYDIMLQSHKNQKRDEGIPYIYHPLTIANWAMQSGASYEEVIICLLHDTIEDDSEHLNYDYLAGLFGVRVADAVAKLSKYDAAGNQIDDALYYDTIGKDPSLVKVKFFDRLHNIYSLFFQPDPIKKSRYIDDTQANRIPFFVNHYPEGAALLQQALDYIKNNQTIPEHLQEKLHTILQIEEHKKSL